MPLKYFLSLFLLLLLISCRSNSGKPIHGNKPGMDEMADLNKYFVQKDRERIKNYIERKNLKMNESPTGLWYQILKQGDGAPFTDNRKITFEYDCSLLDGTLCYSSETLGPKEVVLGKSNIEAGLNEGLHLLKPGAEAIFILPPFLAFGLRGDGKKIPSRAIIVYNVNILQSK